MADTEQPTSENLRNAAAEAPSPQDPGVEGPPATQPTSQTSNLPINIPPEVIAQAKMFGIDLGQIVVWAQNVEKRLQIADENFQKLGTFLAKTEPLIKLSEQIRQQQQNPQPTQTKEAAAAPPGNPLLNPQMLLQIMQGLGGGSGGGGELQQKFMERIMEAGFESMFQGTQLMKAVTNRILTEAGANVAKEVIAKT